MKIILALILALPLLAQTKDAAPRGFPPYTIAAGANQRPAASLWPSTVITVTDGLTASDCTTGGGSTAALCRSNGTSWISIGGSSGAVSSVTAGATGAQAITPTTGAVVVDVDTAYVPGKTTTNVWTGSNTFSGASLTAPARNATPASSTAPCTQWEQAVDASFYYLCTAPNTWKRVSLSAF